MPLPRPDIKTINETFEQMGDMGILRAGIFNHQGGCWQDACNYFGTQRLIMETYDDPAWVHEFLGIILDYKLRFVESLKGARIDMLENGGGDGCMSVISPKIFAEYGVPYDKQTTAALHDIGIKTVYHTCGRMMAQLDLVKETGCDATETLTPPDMGGDADLRRSKRPWATPCASSAALTSSRALSAARRRRSAADRDVLGTSRAWRRLHHGRLRPLFRGRPREHPDLRRYCQGVHILRIETGPPRSTAAWFADPSCPQQAQGDT